MRRLIRAFGHALQWAIHTGITLIGRPVDLATTAWLDGPLGESTGTIGPAFYRRFAEQSGLHQSAYGRLRVAYFPLHEMFNVYPAEAGTIRTDHTLHFADVKFLTLHYHIRRKASR